MISRAPSLPQTPAELVEHWKRAGFQHFHLSTAPGGWHRPYITWLPVFKTHTPLCDDRARCLILKIRP